MSQRTFVAFGLFLIVMSGGTGFYTGYTNAMDTDRSRSRECSPLNATSCDRPPNPCQTTAPRK